MSTSSHAFDRGDRAQALLESFEGRRAAGEGGSLEDLIAAHPELEGELRELAAACNDVDRGFGEQAERARQARLEVEEILAEVSAGSSFAGRYTLEGEVGKGGMGAVMRVRDRKLDRALAMKVILGQSEALRSGETPPVSPHQLKRFLNEAKITSQLDHPGIVPVHEVGVDEEGRVYFTMKLVQGKTLAELLELHRAKDPRFGTAKLLDLVQRVCEAVAFAHDRGVIHRDLKPQNVMVGDFGEVYVMDWGLARRLSDRNERAIAEAAEADAALTAELTLTRQGRIVGTPCYMPPEQAKGEIARMGPPCDVYAIGAMLHELVAGSPPYVGAGEKVSSEEILARIEAGPPARLPERSGSPELLAITEKAMGYTASVRYPSVRELAEDLERFIAGRTVRALKVGAWSELEKWVKRNKALATAMASAVLLLVAGLTASLIFKERADARARDLAEANDTISLRSEALAVAIEQAQHSADIAHARRAEADLARAEAVAEKDNARRSAEETKLVADFQSEMLAGLSMDEFGHQIEVELDRSLGESLERLGRGKEEIEAARAGLKEALRPSNLTNVAKGLLQATLFEPAVRGIEEKYEESPSLAAMLQTPLAETLRGLGMFELGERVAREAVAARRATAGADHVDTLTSINHLALLLHAQGKLAEAEPLYREALTGRRAQLGDEHPSTLISSSNLASLLQAQGKLAEAEPLFHQVLTVRRAKLGDGHLGTLASIKNVAGLLQAQGKLAEAEPLFREALTGLRAELGDQHPDTLPAINNLANLLYAQNKLAEAEPLIREALTGCRAKLGDEHPYTLISISNLASLLQAQGKVAEAESLFREALAGLRAKLGDEHSETLISLNNLASLLQAQGKLAEAEPLHREALAACRVKLGNEHPETLTSINNLTSLLQTQGRLAEAEPLLLEALTGRRAKLGDEHPHTLNSISNLAALLYTQGRLAEAEPLVLEALTVRRATLGDDHPDTRASVRSALALYARLHERDPAAGYDRLAAELRPLLKQ